MQEFRKRSAGARSQNINFAGFIDAVNDLLDILCVDVFPRNAQIIDVRLKGCVNNFLGSEHFH